MSKKQLTEARVLEIMREEWKLRVEGTKSDLDVFFKPHKGGDEHMVISPELKIKHKESGLLYTVDQVGTNSVVLRTPEDKQVEVPAAEFEKQFELK